MDLNDVITILQQVNKKLMVEAESKRQHVASGVCKDLADYKHVCGQIFGLNEAHQTIKDIIRKMEGTQDD